MNLTFKTTQGLVNACSDNLNGGGIFINTPKTLPKGERFFLNLKWADMEPPMKIGCEVVWVRSDAGHEASKSNPVGMGVKFVQIAQKDRQKLVETLNS